MTTSTVPVLPTTRPVEQSDARRALSGLWPLAAAGVGITSFVFTRLTSRSMTDAETEGGVAAVYAAVEGDGTRTQVGVVAAFASVVLLAVLAAGFGRFLTARAPSGSLAAQVARLGLTATVATVALAASPKAISRGALPDHGDAGMCTEQAVVRLQIRSGWSPRRSPCSGCARAWPDTSQRPGPSTGDRGAAACGD